MTHPFNSNDNDQIVVELYDSFMKKLLRNRSRTLKKRRYRYATHEFSVSDPTTHMKQPHVDDGAGTNTLSIQGYAAEIMSDFLYNALLALPEDLRLVIVLLYWFDWTTQDVAIRCNVTERTIRNRRDKALMGLRKMLEGVVSLNEIDG